MRSSASLVALAALSIGETMAGPTHAHLHRSAHEKKDLAAVNWETLPWNDMGIDWSTVNYGGGSSSTTSSAPAPTITTTASAAAKVQPTSSASSASSAAYSVPSAVSGLESLFQNLWNDIQGVSNGITAFGGTTPPSGSEVSYIGNVGFPWGSNCIIVESTKGYDFTITVVNTATNGMTINLWNKAGKDGQANSGATSAPKETVLTFYLAVGASAIVAVAENSQGALCEATDNIHSSGAFATTWAEYNMVSGGPAYDVSAILNTGTYDMSISAEEIACVSSPTQNSWVTETQTIGSGDCFLYGNSAHLTVQMGGQQ